MLGVRRPRSGAICFVQRFGGSLNLNVHYHVVIPDGVFSREGNGSAVRFEKVGAPSGGELEDLVLAVEARVIRWLERQGLLASEASASDDSEPQEPSALDACLVGSLGIGELVRLKSATVALAPDAAPAKAKKSPRPGHIRGFDIHAGVVVSGDDSDGRDARSKPAPCEGAQASHESASPRGQRAAEQHVRSASGLPIAALVDPPAADPAPESAANIGKRRYSVDGPVSPAESSRIDWAQLLKRTYDIDALACSCGGRLTFIATILEPTVARSILKSLGMEPRPPPTARARSPDWIDDIPVDTQVW